MVVLIGRGVKKTGHFENTTQGLLEAFGERRVIDTTVSGSCITGIAVGAAIAGMRPILVYPQMDLIFNDINSVIKAANCQYMNGGRASVPVVIWGTINRTGKQVVQHSQALYGACAHNPGLKVVMPVNAYDAKGLMISAIRDSNPVVFMDDRLLYDSEEEVPEEIYEVPIGKGVIRKMGSDLTLVASSFMVQEALKAVQVLADEKIEVELIDLRTIRPLDQELIFESVKKTGRLLIAEIADIVSEIIFNYPKITIKRVTLQDCLVHSIAAPKQTHYPIARTIAKAARELLAVKHPMGEQI